MPDLYLKNCDIVTPAGVIERGSLAIRSGLIDGPHGTRPAGAEEIDLQGSKLLPGFVDIHCHGAAGADVNDGDVEGLIAAGRYLARNGVTGWVPTLVPDSTENYEKAVAAIEELMGREPSKLGIARVLGIHYEGVFANESRCGALRKGYFREFSEDSLDELPIPAEGVKLMTLAPEIEGGIDLVGALADRGWIASAGHTSAPVEVLDSAFEAGLKHLTHFFNAMDGIHHRSLGVAGWGLTREGVTFDIIADGNHVHPDLLAAVTRMRGIRNVILISDSISAAGLGDGEYEVWGKKIIVSEDGAKDDNGTISGSVISMGEAFNQVLSKGFSIAEASSMASANPARLLGIDHETGSIAPNKRADLTAWKHGEAVLTVIAGRVAYNAL